VKTGSGAFMKTEKDAVELAELLVDTGTRMGKRVVALVTNMDQPLGWAAGNSLEVIEAIEVLGGGGPQDLRDLCLELAAWMFYLGDRAASVDEGRRLAAEQIASGCAKEKFREIIRLQQGDAAVVDEPARMPRARHTLEIAAPEGGYLQATQCEQLGLACVALGAGRKTQDDTIDPAVGLVFHHKIGDAVKRGESLCTVHYNSPQGLDEVRHLIETSLFVGSEPVAPQQLVRRVIGA
jgi:thymidine phosphorylase